MNTSTGTTEGSRLLSNESPQHLKRDSYEEAVRILRNLKMNKYPQEIQDHRLALFLAMPSALVLEKCAAYQEACGLSLVQLDTLNVVHVAGTKGKGSTCAFVESILRHSGLRTGFYSTPHLVAVRERIRINGKPISQEKFAHYFFQVIQNLENYTEAEFDYPFYLYPRLLTCLGFYIFYHEKVDVVICEVGIGGRRDATNITRVPIVTGITSLGLDHQRVLGETLEEIAKAKAGIMKANVPCFTLSSHSPQILQVLQENANLVRCPLLLVPSLETYAEKVDLGIDHVPITSLNASLAIQLSTAFLQIKFPGVLSPVLKAAPLGFPFELQPWHRQGLANCSWPGRFQVVHRNPTLAYYLDGAHTLESLDGALAWFTQSSPRNDSTTRILVFSVTCDRNVEKLIRPFAVSGHFHSAIFCPILKLNFSDGSQDDWTLVEEEDGLKKKAIEICSIWKVVSGDREYKLLPSVDHVVDHLDELSKHGSVNVLITGSLMLVGAFISLLQLGKCFKTVRE